MCIQVSHHPPVSALHATSPHIIFEANICPKLRFLGTQVTIKPEGEPPESSKPELNSSTIIVRANFSIWNNQLCSP